MTRTRRIPRQLDPVVAVGFGVLWVVAEAGRVPALMDSPGEALRTWAAVVGYVAAVAVARWSAIVSIGLITLIPLLQAVGVLDTFGPTRLPVLLAALWVAFEVARSGRRAMTFLSLGLSPVQATMLGIGVQSTVDAVYSQPDPVAESDPVPLGVSVAVLYLGLFAVAWILGFVMRMESEKRAERRRLAAVEADLQNAEIELQRIREREVIAQEVHDVLAHSLAVVAAMADGSRFIREKRPETTDAALRDIADAARSALVDLRGLMEELTDQTERPLPGLGDIDALLERMRGAGLLVTVVEHGEAAGLAPAQELAVFRIVQEALTNALKHAGRGSAAFVSLDWRGPGLAITVRSAGAEPSQDAQRADSPHERGFGIRGMTDRARSAGGWLTAESTSEDGGGYLVTAFIPTAVRVERAVA